MPRCGANRNAIAVVSLPMRRALFMQNLFRFCLLAAVVTGPALCAQPVKKLGEIKVEVDGTTIPVRVSANTPELQSLAQTAFGSHGRFRVDGAKPAYDIKFTLVAATQVRVDVTKGAAAAPVVSQVVSGTTARNALLRAADVAVEKTNQAGLRGFFTARLAFISKSGGNRGDVYASDLFLGEARRLTQDNAFVLSPRWSPDGSRILFTSYFKNNAPDIYFLDPNTGRKDLFANYRGTNMGARFSPNGQQVAMVLTVEGTPEIYTRSAQGGQPVRKTRSDTGKSSPCWSPDGSQIVFEMEPGPQLYVMSAAGGAPRRLTSSFGYSAEADWSRTNPNKIVCSVRVNGRFQIAVIDVASGAGKVVSKAPFDGVEPSWLADGRHVVYTARDRTTSVLCVLDTETGSSFALGKVSSASEKASVWTP